MTHLVTNLSNQQKEYFLYIIDDLLSHQHHNSLSEVLVVDIKC